MIIDSFTKNCLLLIVTLTLLLFGVTAFKGCQKAKLIKELTGREVTPLEAEFITIVVTDTP
jgi:hypothetical protein